MAVAEHDCPDQARDRASVLVVDDDRSLTSDLSRFFRESGYDVAVAHTGQAALDALRAASPWVLLLDLQLPDLHGVDVIRAARQLETAPDVIVATRVANPESTLAVAEAGAAGYVIKPIDPARLGDLIHRLCERRRQAADQARRQSEQTQRTREMEVLSDLAARLNSTLEIRPLLRDVTRRIAQALRADRCSVQLFEGGGIVPVMSQFADGHSDPEMWRKFKALPRLVTDTQIHVRVMAARAPIAVDDVETSHLAPAYWRELFEIRSALIVPLIRRDEVIGTMNLDHTRAHHHFTEREIELAMTIASQVALTLDNARLYGQTQRRLHETIDLFEISRILGSTLELQPLLKEIALRTAKAVGVERCTINLWRDRRVVPVMSQFADGRVEPAMGARVEAVAQEAADALPAHVSAMNSKRPVVIDDAVASAGQVGHLPESFGVRALLVVPLLRHDAVIGTLDLDYVGGPHRWEQAQVDLATTIASHVALAVDNAQLFEQARNERRRLEVLYGLSRRLAAAQDTNEILSLIANEAARLLGAEAGALRLLEGDELVLKVRTHAAAGLRLTGRLKVGASLAGRVLSTRAPLAVDDVTTDPRCDEGQRRALLELGLLVFLGVPLLADGRAIGTLTIFRRTSRFTSEEVSLLSAFADTASLAIAKGRALRDAEERRDIVERLHRVGVSLQTSWNRDDRLRAFIQGAHDVLGFDRVFVSLAAPDQSRIEVVMAHCAQDAPMGGPLTPAIGAFYQVFTTARPLAVLTDEDLAQLPPVSPDFLDNQLLRSRRFVLAPLVFGGRVLGVVFADNKLSRRPLDPATVEPLTLLCQQLAAALEETRLYEETQRRLARLQALTRLNQLISASLNTEEVLQEITRAVARLTDATLAFFWRADDAKRELEIIAFSEPTLGATFATRRVSYDWGIVGRIARKREIVDVPDILAETAMGEMDWWRANQLTSYYGIPVVHEGTLLAVLALAGRRPFQFESDDRDLLESFVAQAAVAIRNAELFAQSERRRHTAEALAELGRALSGTLDPDTARRQVVERVRALFGVRLAVFFDWDPESETLRAVAVSSAEGADDIGALVFPRGTGVVGLAVKEGRPVFTENVLGDRRVVLPSGVREYNERVQDAAVLALPLVVNDGILGALSLVDRRGRVFNDEDVRRAQAFAGQAALAIQKARLYQEAEGRRRVAESLAALGRLVSQSLDAQEVGQRIVDSVRGMTGALRVAFYRLQPSGDLAVFAASNHADLVLDGSSIVFHAGTGIVGVAVRERRTAITPNLLQDPSVLLSDEVRARFEPSPIRTVMAVPLVAGETVIGAMIVADRLGRVFTEDEVGLTEAAAHQAAIALENARLYDDATRQARQMTALADLGRALSETLDVDVVGQRVTESIRRLLSLDRVTLYRLEPQTGDLLALAKAATDSTALEGRLDRVPAGTAVVGRAVEDRLPMATADLVADPRITLTPAQRARLATVQSRAVLAVPLIVQDRVIGGLSLGDRVGRVFSDEEVRLAQTFAAQAAIALENARLYAAQELRANGLRALAGLNRIISSSLDANEVLGRIAQAAADLMEAPLVEFWFADEAARRLELRVFSDAHLGADKGVRTLAFGQAGVGWAAVHRSTLNIPNVFVDERIFAREWWDAHGLTSGLWVPIVLQDELLGVLSLIGRRPFRLGPDQQELLESFVAQAAEAIRNARLYEESEARRQAAEALAEVGRGLSQALDPGEVAQRTVDSVCQLLHCQASALFRLEPSSGDLVRLAVSGGVDPLGEQLVFPKGIGVMALAVRERTAVATPDLLADSSVVLTPEMRGRIEQAGYRAVLAVPLLVQDRVIGALAVGDWAGRRFDRQQVQLAQTFADQAALALENARLYAEATRKAGQMKALADLGRLLSETLELDAVAQRIADSLRTLLTAEDSALYRLDLDSGSLVSVALSGNVASQVQRLEFPRGYGVAGFAVEERQPVITSDLLEDPRLRFTDEMRAQIQRVPYRATLCVPLLVKDRVIGALAVGDRRGRVFEESDIHLAQAFADQAAVALENARLYGEAHTQRTQLTQILDSTTDGIMFIGPDGRIEAANRRATELIGIEPTNVIGEDLVELLARHGATDDDDLFRASLRSLFIDAAGGEGDLALPRLKRVLRWLTRPTRDAGGQTVGLTLTLQDVTKEREVSQMKTDFVSFVTHQLRTPLSGIKWMLELAGQETQVPESVMTCIQDAHGASERLITLVNDLLDISRLERGKLEVSPRPTDLVALTHEVMVDVQPLVKDKGHRLTIAAPSGLPAILVDPQLMRQVILNLTSNAIKYTLPDGTISIRVRREGAVVLWAIQDSGIGIPKEAQRRLFEKFYRADNVYAIETEGTGLGLYLVRLIIERFGGRVWCESQEGQGATFLFTLPLSEPSR